MMQIEELYDLFLQNPLICTDTRNILPESIFVCLKGERFDGNEFALSALERGAKWVITEDRQLAENPRCIVVDDSLATLQNLAAWHRKQLAIPIIGITGTNGKTTTKELIVAVLAQKYRVAYTKGNFNNHIGVPLTLLSITADDEIAVVEMGANHVGEIAELCHIVQPNFGVITNIGAAHLEGFGSVKNIIATKSALYESVKANFGTLFINGGDEILRRQVQRYKQVVFYGKHQKSGTHGKVLEMTPFLRVDINGKKLKTHLTGNYNLPNLLAAAAVGQFFQVDNSLIISALRNYRPQNQRSQIVKKKTNTIIADFYNANPTSMEAALRNFKKISAPKKLAILGEMKELGAESEKAHKAVVNLCNKLDIKALYVGEAFKNCAEPRRFFIDTDAVNRHLQWQNLRDTLVLIKGSRGMHLENVKI